MSNETAGMRNYLESINLPIFKLLPFQNLLI